MVRIFCDFDATITTEDVGESFFREFGKEKAAEVIENLLEGKITSGDSLHLLCNAISPIDLQTIEKFISQFSVDSYFTDFVKYCEARDIPITILSDGLDFYIEKIFALQGVDYLKYFSNHLDFVNENGQVRLVPSFPYRDSECVLCGNCKRNHMLTLSGDDDVLVYIGDGFSDQCPVRYADIVFAKRKLIHYCQMQNISYHEFSTFKDIQLRLHDIIQQKRIKQRRQAEMARREVFLQG